MRGSVACLRRLDALHSRQGNGVQIDRVAFRAVGRHASSVEQHERARSAEAAQIGAGISAIYGTDAIGGVINFISEHNKVRFEINSDVARRTGLTISSELLKLAKLVKS